MQVRTLPSFPNLEHLKQQAHALLRDLPRDLPGGVGDASAEAALGRFAAQAVDSVGAKLADALHVVAKEYGFGTWPELKRAVMPGTAMLDGVEDGTMLEALSAAVRAGDAAAVRAVASGMPAGLVDEPLPGVAFDMPALVVAAERGDAAVVEALLDAGADANVRTRWWAGGFTALEMADEPVAQLLLGRGARLTLHAAARMNRLEEARSMLAADPGLVRTRGGDGKLPLHYAATVEMAELLVGAGAEGAGGGQGQDARGLDARGLDGQGQDARGLDARDVDHESTAAEYAVSWGVERAWVGAGAVELRGRWYRHDVARWLVERGAEAGKRADVMMLAALGDLARMERLLNDDPEVVRVTVSEHFYPKRDPRAGGHIYIYGFGRTKTPHVVAHEFGRTAVFELLMQRSAPWLRLVQAAEIGDRARVEQVVAAMPGLLSRLNPQAARRLVGAAGRNNTLAVELLCEKGWPAGAALENGQTALHFAAFHGNAAMARALLRAGAAVNVFETEHGGSPLAWALYGSLHGWERATGDYPAVVEALRAAGAELPEGDRVGSEEVLRVLRG